MLRHTTRDVQAKITEVLYRIDINTLHRVEDDVTIGVNDMARVRIKNGLPPHRRLQGQPRHGLLHPR